MLPADSARRPWIVDHGRSWHRSSCSAVCAGTKITGLSAALTAAGAAGPGLALVLPGGAAGLDAAGDGVVADPRLRLRAVEAPAAARAPVPAAVADAAAAPARAPRAGAAAVIEVPARDVTAAAARAAGEHRHRATARDRRPHGPGVPGDRTLAHRLVTPAPSRPACNGAAGVPRRGRAVSRGPAPGRGHRFGVSPVPLTCRWRWQQPSLPRAISNLDAETVSAVRSLFTSSGTGKTDEPVHHLAALGLAGKD
jgi:hypothetical protein